MPKVIRAVLATLLCLAAPLAARADEALVAVAANFADTLEALRPGFEATTGHRLIATTGSTGKLSAQIASGAPFDLLLSADDLAPAALARDGLALEDTRMVYAVGQLALFSADPAAVGPDGRAALENPALRHLAIANPALAPYGRAAQQTLENMGLWQDLQPRLVMGQNVGQAYALTATGAAELGFVALTSVMQGKIEGSFWPVPATLHDPIRQEAIVLAHGRDNAAAHAFLGYLSTPEAAAIIAAQGYRSAAE